LIKKRILITQTDTFLAASNNNNNRSLSLNFYIFFLQKNTIYNITKTIILYITKYNITRWTQINKLVFKDLLPIPISVLKYLFKFDNEYCRLVERWGVVKTS
jgi:hypothetical protein